ncbi:MAG: DUF1858 domain-containing protein [Candidatus Pacebacteria bacterium]|nr:DUF1858 domain-containing protein [Candidatus Paceibacterota bacterium]
MAGITENTTLSEILDDPKFKEILARYNFPCLSCPFAQYEVKGLKLGDVCKMYDIDVKKLLKELNEVIKK